MQFSVSCIALYMYSKVNVYATSSILTSKIYNLYIDIGDYTQVTHNYSVTVHKDSHVVC